MNEILVLNEQQREMLDALSSLMNACKEKRAADKILWDLKDDKDAFEAYQLKWQEIFEDRTNKREFFCDMIVKNPELAGDLCERFAKRIDEEKEISRFYLAKYIDMQSRVADTEFPYLSQCGDFELIKNAFEDETLAEIEEAIRLYEDTDVLVYDGEKGALCHKNGEDWFSPAVEWYAGLIDTKSFVSEFGDKANNVEITGTTRLEQQMRAAEKMAQANETRQRMLSRDNRQETTDNNRQEHY